MPRRCCNRLHATPLLVAAIIVAGPVWAQAAAPASGPVDFTTLTLPAILTVHGVGAQIYECKALASGAQWTFREPIATLVGDGKTVGRHYAGPSWDLTDGSGVSGKLVASQPSASVDDIPSLDLQVVAHRGTGLLSEAGRVLRLHTLGGVLKGACQPVGALRSVPYEADYVFMK